MTTPPKDAPVTEAGRRLLRSLAEMAEHQAIGKSYIKPPTRFVAEAREIILAIEAEAATAARSDEIDVAWAEAEAALPEGGWLVGVQRDWPSQEWFAEARGWVIERADEEPHVSEQLEAETAESPAAALHALAAHLRSEQGERTPRADSEIDAT